MKEKERKNTKICQPTTPHKNVNGWISFFFFVKKKKRWSMLAIKDEIITITMRALYYGAIKTRKCVPQNHLKDMKYHDG